MKLKNLVLHGELIDLNLITIDDKYRYYEAGFKESDNEIDYYTGTKAEFTKENTDKIGALKITIEKF